MSFFKILYTSLIGYGITRLIDWALSKAGTGLGYRGILLIYCAVVLIYIYWLTPKRNAGPSARAIEYILNGQGEPTSQRFLLSQFPGYTEMQRSADGRIFADSTGKILFTRYVTKGGSKNAGVSPIHLVFACILSISLGLMMEQLLPGLFRGILQPLLDALLEKLSQILRNLTQIGFLS